MATSNIYYQSIDEMTLKAWQMCLNGHFEYVRRDKKEIKPRKWLKWISFVVPKKWIYARAIRETDACLKTWEKIYDEYLKKHGLEERYLEFLKLEQSLVKARLDYVINRDRKILNRVDMIEAKIKMMHEFQSEPTELAVTLVHLSKFYGIKLSIFETTVEEFFTYLNEYKKYVADGKENNQK